MGTVAATRNLLFAFVLAVVLAVGNVDVVKGANLICKAIEGQNCTAVGSETSRVKEQEIGGIVYCVGSDCTIKRGESITTTGSDICGVMIADIQDCLVDEGDAAVDEAAAEGGTPDEDFEEGAGAVAGVSVTTLTAAAIAVFAGAVLM